MLEPAYQVDVVIVGAGIAGLSAAHRLTSAGITTAVLGGRPVRRGTDVDREGRRLSARPHRAAAVHVLPRTPPDPGPGRPDPAPVRAGRPCCTATAAPSARARRRPGERTGRTGRAPCGARPRRRPPGGRRSRPRSGGRRGGQARLGTALGRIAATPVERILARPEMPAAQALAQRGVPARTVDGFLRPLLATLLCDPGPTHLQQVR
ncbi:FAD-binding protein [Streptomyces tricolor]|nr:FAD-binding protein [Streptomyces tricolor]